MNTNNVNETRTVLAQGMTNIYDDVSTSVASAIKQDLLEHFGKGLYYRLKSGEKHIRLKIILFLGLGGVLSEWSRCQEHRTKGEGNVLTYVTEPACP